MMTGRRIILILVALMVFASPLAAQRDQQSAGAISSGLQFLAQHQADDGSISDSEMKIASSGLALISFMGSGQVQDVGRHGLTVRRSMDFLIQAVPDDGYIGRLDGSGMYGQALVTVALCEALTVEPDVRQRTNIRAAVDRCIAAIYAAQDFPKAKIHQGGWGRDPKSDRSDLASTAMNLVALRAARNIGASVPVDRIDQAIEFIMRCYRADGGGFAPDPQSQTSALMTRVGVATLGVVNASSRLGTGAGAQLIMQSRAQDLEDPFAAASCSTQAALSLGTPTWSAVWEANRDRLLAAQATDGAWEGSRSGYARGKIYSTSLAILTLSVPMRVLSALQ